MSVLLNSSALSCNEKRQLFFINQEYIVEKRTRDQYVDNLRLYKSCSCRIYDWESLILLRHFTNYLQFFRHVYSTA